MSNKTERANDKKFHITAAEVINVLDSRNYIEDIFNEIILKVKETSAYNMLKEKALVHFTNNLSTVCEESGTTINICNKAQATVIGNLSVAIATIITNLVSEKLKSVEDDMRLEVREIIENIKQGHTIDNLAEKPTNIEQLQSNMSAMVTEIIENLHGHILDDLEEIPLNIQSLSRSEEESNEDSDTNNFSPNKRSQRTKRPNSKYFSKDMVSHYSNSSSDEGIDDSTVQNKVKRRKI